MGRLDSLEDTVEQHWKSLSSVLDQEQGKEALLCSTGFVSYASVQEIETIEDNLSSKGGPLSELSIPRADADDCLSQRIDELTTRMTGLLQAACSRVDELEADAIKRMKEHAALQEAFQECGTEFEDKLLELKKGEQLMIAEFKLETQTTFEQLKGDLERAFGYLAEI